MRRVAYLAEAMVTLVLARVALGVVPIRRLLPSASQPGSGHGELGPPDPRVRLVAWAVERGAARLPWHSKCLVRALAGRFMLARRGVPSVLWFGVAKDGHAIKAHAWLRVGGFTVCGGREAAGFEPVAAVRTGSSA